MSSVLYIYIFFLKRTYSRKHTDPHTHAHSHGSLLPLYYSAEVCSAETHNCWEVGGRQFSEAPLGLSQQFCSSPSSLAVRFFPQQRLTYRAIRTEMPRLFGLCLTDRGGDGDEWSRERRGGGTKTVHTV